MLKQIIKHSCRFSQPMNLRSLKSSPFLSTQIGDEDGGENENYWKTETNEDPSARTIRVMSKQMRDIKNQVLFWREPETLHQNEWDADTHNDGYYVDIAIIGSGAIANSAAFWLKEQSGGSLTVVVIEPEGKFHSSTSPALTSGGLRLQYALEENTELSLESAKFFRNINEHLRIRNGPSINLEYSPSGCLRLASEAGAEHLIANSKFLDSVGVKNLLLTPEELKKKFPWVNTDDVALGCLGLEKEGWLDPDTFNLSLKRKNITTGIQYITGEVKGFVFKKSQSFLITPGTDPNSIQKCNHVVLKSPSGQKVVVQYSMLILATEHETTKITKLLNIGSGKGPLSVPLPLEPRKEFVFQLVTSNGPNLNTPLLIDPAEYYFRRNGLANYYLVGLDPLKFSKESSIDYSTINSDYFYNQVLPVLQRRIPSLKDATLDSFFSEYYDYNFFDGTGIFGQHATINNLIFATGFGPNSLYQAPAIGLILSEYIVFGQFRTVNLSRFAFDRFITLEPQVEVNLG